MARRLDGEFGEGTVLDALEDGFYLVVWNEESQAAKLDAAELMPFGSGMGLSTERRQRVAPAFILNNFLMKTAIPSNDLSRVQMVVRDGADVNCTDSEGNSPLNLAASSCASVPLIQFLISRGAHVNFVGAAGTALQSAGMRNQVDVVRCLLSHGADASVVDIGSCAEEAAQLLRASLQEMAAAESAPIAPLSGEEKVHFAGECFVHLVPALVTCLGGEVSYSPKLHKRVLMVLSLLVQRALEPQLVVLPPLQLGAMLGALRALLASPQPLEQFVALRMLGSCLKAWPDIACTARRHGLELLLAKLSTAEAPTEEVESPGSGHSSRARNIGLRQADVVALAASVLALLKAVPVAPDEGAARAALARLPGLRDFRAATQQLAALLLGTAAPSPHEVEQSGILTWLLAELGSGCTAELRARWRDFEAAFGTQPGAPGGAALAQLLQLLHNTLAASEQLPIHSYTSGGEGAYSLKPLSDPIQICLHPLGALAPADGASERHCKQLSLDPLVRVRELQLQLMRTSAVSDTAYEAFCTRLLGCVIEERPLLTSGSAEPPLRRAIVTALHTATPMKLLLHTLRHEDGSEVEVVLATREYRIIGRVPEEELLRLRGDSSKAAEAGTVADPEARVHTVSIHCPEGLPVELFLDNVMSEVRRALRQAEPGCAPMTRSAGDDYGWRDRGWERGGTQFERTLADKLRENGVGAVARRQTNREAEVLTQRLKNTVMVFTAVEKPDDTHSDAEEEGSSERFALLARVQGLVAADSGKDQAQWVAATVVDTSGAGISLMFDDGTFEASVPAYRVRAVPVPDQTKRLNPLAAIFMSFEQFLSSREERRAEAELAGRESTPANLRRTLSAFHIGRVQQVGHVERERLSNTQQADYPMRDAPAEVGKTSATSASGTSVLVCSPTKEASAFDIAPMQLQVRFGLGSATEPPVDAGICFEDGIAVLHSLQRLREAAVAQGLPVATEPMELGFHPGVTCDRTGQCPITGNRYKLRNENYDVCEAEFMKMSDEEKATFTKMPPPCFRKSKGCGPAVWHVWYSLQVADGVAGSQSGAGEPGTSSSSPAIAASAAAAASGLPWACKEVEDGLLSGRMELDAVLCELRRVAPAVETRLAEASSQLLASADKPTLPQLMALYREVSAAPRAVSTTSAPLPPPSALTELRAELRNSAGRCGDGEFADAAMLLWLLSNRLLQDDALALPTAGPASLSREVSGGEAQGTARHFVSARLSAKLLQQLTDALAVASGALPQWCRLLMRACPHLFTPRARSQYFRSTAFGISRALHWTQEQQVAAVRSAYAEELAALERARLEAELSNDPQGLAEVVEQLSEIEDRVARERLGALKSDIARVQRDKLLPQAQRLMSLHARSRHQLEIQFEGESGFGTGVTQNFYSAVANELLKAREHDALAVWLADSLGADADGFINHGGALFPRPLPASAPAAEVTAVCERFRFLGRLMAKACRDSFIVPLPLSSHFLHLVVGGTLSYAAFPAPGATGGVAAGYASLSAALAAIDVQALGVAEARRRYEEVADADFAQARLRMGSCMSFREWTQAGGCTFTCPVTGIPLCAGGEERELSVHNLQEYTHLLAQFWLADGVQPQVHAFREGLEEVFGAASLAPFSLSELQTLLCGTMSIEWSEGELQRHINPSGGYNKHSKVYQLLIDELQRMGNEERRKFLNFVTACPHLPPVGLSMLEIEVLPQHNGTFPTAQTCGNKLYLPEYDHSDALRTGLSEAFANADYGGLHEHQ